MYAYKRIILRKFINSTGYKKKTMKYQKASLSEKHKTINGHGKRRGGDPMILPISLVARPCLKSLVSGGRRAFGAYRYRSNAACTVSF